MSLIYFTVILLTKLEKKYRDKNFVTKIEFTEETCPKGHKGKQKGQK